GGRGGAEVTIWPLAAEVVEAVVAVLYDERDEASDSDDEDDEEKVVGEKASVSSSPSVDGRGDGVRDRDSGGSAETSGSSSSVRSKSAKLGADRYTTRGAGASGSRTRESRARGIH